MKDKPLRIIVIDDVCLVLRCISAQIDKDPRIQVVGQAVSGEKGLLLIEKLRPDLVLLDIKMPHQNGFDVLKKIKNAIYKCKVVMMSTLNNGYIKQALKKGAVGYISKYQEPEDIVKALIAISNGMICTPAENLSSIKEKYNDLFSKLTEKEREISLKMTQQPSLTSKQIANKLGVSINTIYTHQHRMYQKLNVKKASELKDLIKRLIN